MPPQKPKIRVFFTAGQIMEYYGWSRPAFDKYIKMGMPAAIINNSWHAHADNIEAWLKKITCKREPDVPEGVDKLMKSSSFKI